MRLKRTTVIAGVASLAIAGAAFAEASRNVHMLNVVLPDGSVEHIRYTGDVAPRIAFVPVREASGPIGWADPFDGFAAFDRIAAEMDARTSAMLQQANLLARTAPEAQPGLTNAALGRMPAGTVSYSYVSTSSSDGATCSRSVQLTSMGAGQQPKVVSQSSGDCAPGGHAVTPAAQPAAPVGAKVVPAKLDRDAKPAVPATRT